MQIFVEQIFTVGTVMPNALSQPPVAFGPSSTVSRLSPIQKVFRMSASIHRLRTSHPGSKMSRFVQSTTKQATSVSHATNGYRVYRSTKLYGHAEGLSCTLRHWQAGHSRCRLIHGYALAFKFVFVSHEDDGGEWCSDFGCFKPIRAWLHGMFDHTSLVAEDDPDIERFKQLDEHGLIALRVVPAVGCEALACIVFDQVTQVVAEATGRRVWLEQVEVREHGGNSATCNVENAPPLQVSDRAQRKPHQGAILS